MSIKINGAYPIRNNSDLANRTISAARTGFVAKPWVRDPSWLALTAPLATDQKFVGLHVVYPGDGIGNGGNFVALSAAGDYTVDWGDGTTPQNYTSGTVAYYEFNYNATGLNGTDAPVTFTDSTDTVNRTAHGYTDNMTARFYNIATTTGLLENVPYFVINATADTFQVSETIGGVAVSLTNDGSAKLLPYKQAIVTVTPQTGQSLTALNLHQKHNQTNLQSYVSGFVDIAIASAYLTDIRISVATPGTITQNIRFSILERINIVRSELKTLENTFYNCFSLREVIDISTSTSPASTLNVTFTDAGDLVNATNHGLANGDTIILTSLVSTTGPVVGNRYFVVSATADTFKISSSYNGTATSLTTNGSGSFVVGTSMVEMFGNCRSLTSVSFFDTSSVTIMTNMFFNCLSLPSVPLFDTSSVTTMGGMFSACASLTSVPLFDTSSVTNMASMFLNCYSLTSVPLFDMSSVTNMTSMFNGCSSLLSVPLFDTSSVTNMSSMFNNCLSLPSVPLFDMSSVTNMSSMFTSCSSLPSVPLFDTSSVTNMTSAFSNCASLTSVPLFDTSSVSNMTSMFNSCFSLTSVPLFDTSSVTNMSSMFNGCLSLTSVPALVTTNVTSGNFSSMFLTCVSISRIQAKNFKFSFSVVGCKLSSAALDEIYTNLPTVSGQTISVSGNYGTIGDTPSIATTKGWTVSG